MRILLAFTAGVVLAGCANRPSREPTPYVSMQSSEGHGYGYLDKYMGNDEYSVVAAGNRFTPRERVAEIALLRAARITQERGRTHFVVLNRKAGTFQMHQAQMVPIFLGGVLTPVPVGERSRAEPTAILLIRLLPGRSSFQPGALDAADVVARLKGRLE